jgi:AcrR family transcriptional regulator
MADPSRAKTRRLSREEKKAQTRAALLEAAARVFPDHGYHGTSVDAVAAAAGFSKGAVYSNFASKEDLFLSVFSEYVSNNLFRADTSISTQRPLEEQARESARLYTEAADRRREWRILLMEFWVAATRDAELREKLAVHYARLRENIAAVVKRRAEEQGLRMRYPDRVAAAALALNEGYMIQHVIDPEQMTHETYGDLLSLFFGGLAALSKGNARAGATSEAADAGNGAVAR